VGEARRIPGWRVALVEDGPLRRQILSRFKQIYEAAGKPEGAALYEAVDSFGKFHAICLNPAGVECCSEIINEALWSEGLPDFFNIVWVAGDEQLNTRL
jgi:hypothetical protein